MFKTCFLFLLFAFSISKIFSQCVAPVSPPACTGSEPLLADNETLNSGTTKWYYGSAVLLNSLTLNGGTLVVCGDLTIDKFYMTSGTIYIRPGARLVIGSGIGAGLVLAGNCYIYNYGTCEIQRNLSLDNGATASNPNVVVNATTGSVFKMSNQYFVINNAFSWFVNNGSAEFWGIITDSQSPPGSVCLGDESSTRMAVLINKVADTYRVPVGSACLNVYQFSQFSSRLTNDPNLYACIGSGHSSVPGCGGCLANNWGAAQVFNGCSSCGALTVLGSLFTYFNARTTSPGHNKLEWQVSQSAPRGFYRVKRSFNGTDYQTIDSLIVTDETITSFYSLDKNPIPGNNYYMITYADPAGGPAISSKTVKIFTEMTNSITVYPTPFKNEFFINNADGVEKVILTDLTGRNISIQYATRRGPGIVAVNVLQKIPPGIYIIHIQTEKTVIAKTIFKE